MDTIETTEADEAEVKFNDKGQVTHDGKLELAKQDANTTMLQAAALHEQHLNQKMAAFAEAGEEMEYQYLVRGAKLKCSCGSHTRMLNLPTGHGIYVCGKAMIHRQDCVVGDTEANIPTFGVCSSEGHPSKDSFWEEFKKKMFYGIRYSIAKEREKIILVVEDGSGNVKGYACTPCIIDTWKDVHYTQRIVENGKDREAGNHPAAVTEKSFLVCAYGGLIEPYTSGQECEE